MSPQAEPAKPDVAALMELMRSFNEASERLKGSHDALQARVAELTRELEEKNRELARKNRLALIGEMAACLAHEIRNPLGGIQMWASILEEDLPEGGEARATLEKMMRGMRGLDRLVEDMLDFARDLQPQPKACDLADILEDALLGAERTLSEKKVTVVRSFARPLPVRADPALLSRVFLNIAVNAAQAAPEGGRLEVSASRNAGRVRATFRDNGPGISAEALPKMFTPFYTSRSRGTGLGLAIAHRIVEAHAGTIAGANHPDGGAAFTVELPEAP
ncbi:MAG: sensor histidine kinase [Planctomycetia bacterium]|nr:sensor histidine kinase [Planctomycetia bacterium]